MNVETSIGENYHFELHDALLVYQGRGTSFVTRHEVTLSKSAPPMLGPAQPLTVSFIDALVRSVGGNVKAELLPENVLAKGDRMIAWWTPQRRRAMFYKNSEGKVKHLNGKVFPKPPLVWHVREGSLRIRALVENKRPTANTKLAVAPFWNLSHDGSVCTGSMRRPESASVAAIASWEQGFYSRTSRTRMSDGSPGTRAGSMVCGALSRTHAWRSRRTLSSHSPRHLLNSYKGDVSCHAHRAHSSCWFSRKPACPRDGHRSRGYRQRGRDGSALSRPGRREHGVGYYGIDAAMMDADVVSETNCVRQPFSISDIGLNKATVLINRINLFWGTQWKALPIYLDKRARINDLHPDIVIGCVDSRAARAAIEEALKGSLNRTSYWLDLGNNAASGQYILGQPLNDRNHRKAERLRTVSELYPEISDVRKAEDPLPSCSRPSKRWTGRSRSSTRHLPMSALAMLSRLFRHGRLKHHGAFFNAVTGHMSALPIDPESVEAGARGGDRYNSMRGSIRVVKRPTRSR